MTRTQLRQFIIDSFKPVSLATPAETIDLIVQNTIDYFNTHSAYKITRMVPVPKGIQIGGAVMMQVQCPPEIKSVTAAYPSAMVEELFSDHPMWVLLGFITLDRYTQDLILLSHTFEGYRIYLGDDFRWKFIKSESPQVGGWLYIQQMPIQAGKVAVVGTKRVLPAGDEDKKDKNGYNIYENDITDDFVWKWIRDYARAQTKEWEGNVLRHAQIVGISNAGQAMADEGKKDQEDLREALRKESRWLMAPVRR